MRLVVFGLAFGALVLCGSGYERVCAGDDAPAEVADLATRRGSDWPGFLGPHRDSRSPETGIRTSWPATGPPLVWQAALGEGYAPPAVSRGRLLHFDAFGNEERLTCRHSETGEVLWTYSYRFEYEDLYQYAAGPRCSPVVDDDRVYIFGVEGELHCVRLIDGRPLWKVDTARRFGVVQNFFGVGSTPLVEGDLLIVQVGGSPPESQRVAPGQLDLVRGNGSGVVAFDKLTGEVRYQLSDELASYSSPTVATIDGRRWCFVFARGGLLAFEPASGRLDFHFPWRARVLESVNASNPVIDGGRVFISETYGPGSALLRTRPGNYEVVWSDNPRAREKALQTHWNTPVLHEGHLYGSSGRSSHEAQLRCIEWETGAVRWSQQGLGLASLLYVDGHLVCLTEYGDLLLLRATPEKFDVVSAAVLRGPPPRATAGEQGAGDPPAAQREGTLPQDGDDPQEAVGGRLISYPAWAAPILARGLLYVRGQRRLACLELIPESP